MRCDECKTEPLTPGHYCECCGRKLSLQERKALDEQKVLVVEKKAAETSWGEPAPVLAKAQPGQRPDRLVGVHFAPEPYVGSGRRTSHRRRSTPILTRTSTRISRRSRPDTRAHAVARNTRTACGTDVAGDRARGDRSDTRSALCRPCAGRDAPASGCVVAAGRGGRQSRRLPCQRLLMSRPRMIQPRTSTATPQRRAARVAVDRPTTADLCSPCQQAFHSCSRAAVLEQHAMAPRRIRSRRLPEAAAPAPEVPVVPPSSPPLPDGSGRDREPPARRPCRSQRRQRLLRLPAIRRAQLAAAPAPAESTIQIKKPAPAPVVEAPAEVAPPQPKASKPAPVAAAVCGPGSPAESSADDRGRGRPWSSSSPRSVSRSGSCGSVARKRRRSFMRRRRHQSSSRRPRRARARGDAGDAPSSRWRRPPGTRAPLPPPKPAPAAPVAPAAAKATASATSRPNTARVPPKNVRQPVTPVKAAAAVVPSPVVAAPAPEAAARASGRTRAEARAAGRARRSVLRAQGRQRDPARGDPRRTAGARRSARPPAERGRDRARPRHAGRSAAHMVNLLRKSKAGASLDNAIVAAVKQWTFVPARKRGEAVSCWFHVGVPVSRANYVEPTDSPTRHAPRIGGPRCIIGSPFGRTTAPPCRICRSACPGLRASGALAATLSQVRRPGRGEKWVASWAASPHGPYPSGNPSAQPDLSAVFETAAEGAVDQTFRLIVKPDLWGKPARLRLSNVFGTRPGDVRRCVRRPAEQRRQRRGGDESAGAVRARPDERDDSRRRKRGERRDRAGLRRRVRPIRSSPAASSSSAFTSSDRPDR